MRVSTGPSVRNLVTALAAAAEVLILAVPRQAEAQIAASPSSTTFVQGGSSQAPAAQTPPPVTAGWQNGFVVQSANGDFRLQFGGLLQTDGRFSLDTPSPFVSTFIMRKARPILVGHIAKFFDFRIMPDFAGGTANVLDAYFDLRFSPALRVRVGKDKTPLGYELLISDTALPFLERSLASSLVPNRDIGVQLQGELARGTVTYAGGVFNGVPDGASSTTDVDANGGKDLAGRIVVQPFRAAGASAARPLSGLGTQLGGSIGRETGALPSLRSSSGGQTYFSYATASGTTPASVASGSRSRVTPAVFYYHGPFGAFAEYTRSTQAISRGASSVDVTNHGWDVTGSWLLTGETATTSLPSPRLPLDPTKGQWGALQIVARVSRLTIDQSAFDLGLAAAGSSRAARSFSIGANWYPVQWVKYYATYEHTAFDGPTTRPSEHTIPFRAQLAF